MCVIGVRWRVVCLLVGLALGLYSILALWDWRFAQSIPHIGLSLVAQVFIVTAVAGQSIRIRWGHTLIGLPCALILTYLAFMTLRMAVVYSPYGNIPAGLPIGVGFVSVSLWFVATALGIDLTAIPSQFRSKVKNKRKNEEV